MSRYHTRSRSRRNETDRHRSSTASRHDGRRRSSRSNATVSRDMHDVFNEFRSVFDPELSDAISLRALSDLDEQHNDQQNDHQDEHRYNNEAPVRDVQDVVDRREQEMPAWARSLISEQAKALSGLKSEIRSLKRKRGGENDGDFEWKKKGNKRQFEFNQSVEEQLEGIAVSGTLLEARTIAEKGLSLINDRNKLIRIADKHGWDAANNYVCDPLAKDDADDKKIRKAVKEAERSREKSKKEREAKSRRVSRARAYAFPSYGSSGRFGQTIPSAVESPSRVVIGSNDKKLSQPRCFRCNKAGHFSRDCVNPADNSK
ncbi:uncharacterized protein LOC110246549 [Exaiptasia diaphana]|uniref:CCHC-type domain-containing protein n=1 Tax=Exaiptasia diaphana TaxID=2652724 RepID=A0A913XQE3_EXADI|nr:uncharacterized protein LOC110246549 [Exaiptasia diaphana]